jgi:hypothetical protein
MPYRRTVSGSLPVGGPIHCRIGGPDSIHCHLGGLIFSSVSAGRKSPAVGRRTLAHLPQRSGQCGAGRSSAAWPDHPAGQDRPGDLVQGDIVIDLGD